MHHTDRIAAGVTGRKYQVALHNFNCVPTNTCIDDGIPRDFQECLVRVSYRIFWWGWEKNMCIEPRPLGRVWGDAPPGKFRNIHALRLLLVTSGALKWLEISY